MTSITRLVCEYRVNPLGIDRTMPRLSWQMQTSRSGARQVAYRIHAASSPNVIADDQADLWDSGRVESDQSVHVVYAGKKLTSRQRVYWHVTVWDETGEAIVSEPAWFEIGLLEQTDWQARWIGANLVGGPRSTIPAPYLRKVFTLPGTVESARLYVTALGLHECSLNGQPVSDDVFVPGWTDYGQRIQYTVYDVTGLLREGENALGAILGDGWAVGHINNFDRQNYVDRPRFLAQLEITSGDGSMITVVSDDSWVYQFGPLLENDLIMGEAYDARLAMPGWDAPGFDAVDWDTVQVFAAPDAALVATNGPTVRRMGEITPISDPVAKGNVHKTRYVFDLGQNMVGRIRLKGSAPAGTTVVLRFAEVLDENGMIYTANLRTARVTDHYTFSGDGEEIWEPKFTFHGFRYVEMANYPGPVDRNTITGIVLYSDMVTTGDFSCSDPLLNQLQQNIQWGQKGNFVDIPTDCPQRDERMGWTGDIQVFVRTAAYNMNVAAFMNKWLQDLADAQSDDGTIPSVAPTMAVDKRDGGPAWADAAVICPWTLYLCYGDRYVLENNYALMHRFMDFMLAECSDYIRCAPGYQGWPGYGDWLAINAVTPRDLIGTAFLAYDARLMAQIAAILGKHEDAATYRQIEANVKAAFANRYLVGGNPSTKPAPPISAEMQARIDRADSVSRGYLQTLDYGPVESNVFNTDLFQPTQTTYALALHFDLLPEDLRPLAAAELVADIERRDMHLSTGFVGAPYLPSALSGSGQLDTAYTLLNQKTWPSWLFPVTQGATTIWERWDGWTPEHGFQSPDMNSFNHYAYGSIGEWLYSIVAGIEIDPAQPGYKHSILRPQPGGGLTHARGTLQTLYGELSSAWTIEQSKFEWTVVIPPNTSATLYPPVQDGQAIIVNGEPVSETAIEVTAGTHRVVVG